MSISSSAVNSFTRPSYRKQSDSRTLEKRILQQADNNKLKEEDKNKSVYFYSLLTIVLFNEGRPL